MVLIATAYRTTTVNKRRQNPSPLISLILRDGQSRCGPLCYIIHACVRYYLLCCNLTSQRHERLVLPCEFSHPPPLSRSTTVLLILTRNSLHLCVFFFLFVRPPRVLIVQHPTWQPNLQPMNITFSISSVS